MKYHILAFGAGFLLDQIFGDPYFLPHPIRRERQRSADRGSF